MSRPAQSEENRQRTRQRILMATKGLVAENGLQALSMRTIGARVGMTAAALYGYFPDKAALVVALWRDAIQELALCLQRVNDEEADSLQALERMGRTYVDFWLTDLSGFRIVFLTGGEQIPIEDAECQEGERTLFPLSPARGPSYRRRPIEAGRSR